MEEVKAKQPKTIVDELRDNFYSILESAENKIYKICVDMCENYCKYPDMWDEDKHGPLYESKYCRNCPLFKLNNK